MEIVQNAEPTNVWVVAYLLFQLGAWVAAIVVGIYEITARGRMRSLLNSVARWDGERWVIQQHVVFLHNMGRRSLLVAGVGRRTKDGLRTDSKIATDDLDAVVDYMKNNHQFVLQAGESRSFQFAPLPGEAVDKPLIEEFAYGKVSFDMWRSIRKGRKTFRISYKKISRAVLPKSQN